MKPITVLVVDDHTLFRRGLIALLSQEAGVDVVGEAADASEALRAAQALRPDLILLDNHMPGMRGVDLLPELRQSVPATRVLMLTVSEDEQDLSDALRNGAQGYLLKTADGEDLAAALIRTMQGESVVSPEMTHKLLNALRKSGPGSTAPSSGPDEGRAETVPLSPREQEILRELTRGASNKEIARKLNIAETTVKIHVQHILRKLGVSSRVQAAVWGSENALGA
ncbi:two-component system nitrate/nitrite response regulator NarL [Paucibacter oligotrophus]|uniref:Two-component system nitrate/nitrite response regulator NarL n=1 Tax=Roseateles oligotrophus TaxID=1769250 RepID=A0A840LHF6_9BURK|nr:response regulator [Roseateles oligotrophus]MBB4845648.1 two-component system nitrate/nitrite response regulator NarL [Roseateles oligotrophus]